jgi:DNA-binding Xre family transcriptional regulator
VDLSKVEPAIVPEISSSKADSETVMLTKLRVKILLEVGPNNQNRLARELSINPARLSQYATGTCRIPAHHLLVLSRRLHCSPLELLGYEELGEVK